MYHPHPKIMQHTESKDSKWYSCIDLNLTSEIKWVGEHFSIMMTVKCPFYYSPTLPLMRISHPPQTFNKDRCNPQAETERVEAQNRRLLAENQKMIIFVALDVLTDMVDNLAIINCPSVWFLYLSLLALCLDQLIPTKRRIQQCANMARTLYKFRYHPTYFFSWRQR